MNRPVCLKELRQRIGDIQSRKPQRRLTTSLLNGGLPYGSIVNASGAGKTAWTCQLIRDSKLPRVAWLEHELSLYPPAIEQHGVELNKVLFIETGHQGMWSVQHIVRSRLFQLVIYYDHLRKTALLRRLQTLTKQHGIILLLLSDEPLPNWLISVRVITQRQHGSEEQVQATIHRRGRAQGGMWSNEHQFQRHIVGG